MILERSENVSNTYTSVFSSPNAFTIWTYSSSTTCLSNILSFGIGPISAAIYTSLPDCATASFALATAALILLLTPSMSVSRLIVLLANVFVLISFAPASIYSL